VSDNKFVNNKFVKARAEEQCLLKTCQTYVENLNARTRERPIVPYRAL